MKYLQQRIKAKCDFYYEDYKIYFDRLKEQPVLDNWSAGTD